MKTYKVRQQQLVDTEEHWNQTEEFIPLDGEFVIYKADEQTSHPRLKLGDGETDVKELPFYFSGGGGGALELDETLTNPAKAAQAQAVGNALNSKIPKGGYVELEDNLIFSKDYHIEVPRLEIKSANEEITNNICFSYYGDSNEKPKLEIGGANGDEPVVITGIASPKDGLDAVNKNYVDSMTFIINARYPNGNELAAPILDNFDYDTIINHLNNQKNVMLRVYINEQSGYEDYYLSNWTLNSQDSIPLQFTYKNLVFTKSIALNQMGNTSFQYHYTQPDSTLNKSNTPAEAQAVGSKITQIENLFKDIDTALDEIIELQEGLLYPDGDEVSY